MIKNNANKIPKISIGMPVFNGEFFINKAINSLLNQTFSDFELIISDNYSTDETSNICNKYAEKDPRIRYFRQPKNMGVSYNFIFVLKQSRSDYFMWAAYDDVWDPKYIEQLLPVSIKYQCLSFGFVQFIDADDNKLNYIANFKKFEYRGKRSVRKIKYYLDPGIRGKTNVIYGIFPAKILKTIDLLALDSEKNGGDFFLNYFLLDKTEIRHGGSVFHYKRHHLSNYGGGMLETKLNMYKRLLIIIKEIFFGPTLLRSIKYCNFIEVICMFALYPVCVLRHIISKINFMIYRSKPYLNCKYYKETTK